MNPETIPPRRPADLEGEEQPTARPQRRLSLDPPLIPPAGRRLDLTNDAIYELIEFP
jgi:hypothetical protein